MKAQRYALVAPVEGGDQFYEITDTKLNIAVVSISASIPNAAKEARNLHSRLEKQAKAEGKEE